MNFRRSISAASLLFLLFSVSVAAEAQGRRGDQDRWQELGRSYVDGRNDHDRIVVNNRESFRALQLEVRGGTIEFRRVVVHFDNGADHQLEIRDRIADRGRSRVIDLPGDSRRINSVEFWYSNERWRSRPYVNLWGLSGGSYGSDDQRRRDDDGRWRQLGRSYVDGSNDHDRIVVNDGESFRALQLEVNGGTIEFRRVVVHFDNGADHQLEIRDRIPDQGRTRVIDLPGDSRRIRSVEFWYSKERWASRPYVNLWGLSGGSYGSDDQRRRDEEYGWEVLGQSRIDGRVDHDRIVVSNRGAFRALQLGIRGGTIEFQRVVVHFENGADHELQIRDRITAPGKTRVIDLPGDRRRITSVEFWYSKGNWRSNPYVNVWGRR